MIHLICGPAGAGKSWVLSHIDTPDVVRLDHDSTPVKEFMPRLIALHGSGLARVVADCPFRVSVVIDSLKAAGVPVRAYFINESLDVVLDRLQQRDGPAGITERRISRVSALAQRAKTHADFTGTSEEVLSNLKENL